MSTSVAPQIGTSGFTLQNFYPKELPSKDRLSFYASVFPTVEINSTFYSMPRQSTVQKWLAQVPSNFVFAFKVFQEITHNQETFLNQALLANWFEIFEVSAKNPAQHIMLFQFPASMKFDPLKFQELLEMLPTTFLYAFEFRHRSWFTDAVFDKVLAHKHTIVISDGPKKKNGEYSFPFHDLKNSNFSYIRFHGSRRLYYSSYDSEELEKYAQLINEKKLQGQPVYDTLTMMRKRMQRKTP